MTGAWLTASELASELGRSASTLRAWRCSGYGPLFVRRGTLILYRREAVEAWLREAEVANTVQARAHQRVSRVDVVGPQANIPGGGATAESGASSLPMSPTTTPHRPSTRAIPEERPAGAACEHPAGPKVA